MDKVIEDKRWIKPKHWKFIIIGAFVVASLLLFMFRDPVSTYRVERDKVSIETVTNGEFNDYISVTGQVVPISTIFLDAIEGGRVEKLIIEEGEMVNKGDVILELTNNNLNLEILNSEAQLAEKSNYLRETRISMEQQKLDIEKDLLQTSFDLKAKKRTYEQNKDLYKEGLISKEEFLLAEEDYLLAKESKVMMFERKSQDSVFRKIQIVKLEKNLENMQKNLELVIQRLENLKVKAPVDGQLGMLDAEIGQSISMGQRLGQINVLESFKIEAEIDEHYIDRVRKGLYAYFDRNTDTFKLELKKVYPEVREGRFIVDLVFNGDLPENIRIGQTYYIKLELGLPQESLLLPRGGFFQSTGGQWVFVLDPSEESAVRRDIKIGRQNPQFYEVLDGLSSGEKVIVSGYDIFGNNEKVVFK